MKKSCFVFVGALALSASGFAALAPRLAMSQPLPVERSVPQIGNLSMPTVMIGEAEKLAMPANGIALHLRDATLAQALTELQKQSGVALNLDRINQETQDKKLSLDLETRLFLPAFNTILDEAGVKASLQRFGRNDVWNVQLGDAQPDNSKTLQSGVGPFQVRLQSVESNFLQTVKPVLGKAPERSQNRSMSITFDANSDPIVDVAGTPLVMLKRVEDDGGHSLLDSDANRWLRYDFEDGWSGGRPQNIQMPGAGAKMLARVEGTTIFVVPSARQKWEIADVTDSKNATHEFEVGGRTVTFKIKSAQLEADRLNLSYEMSAIGGDENGEAGSPLFSFGQMRKVIRLEDANGNVLGIGGSNGSSSGNKIEMRGDFSLAVNPRFDAEGKPIPLPALAEPIKLVFDGPTQWVQTEVPFSFENVPLP